MTHSQFIAVLSVVPAGLIFFHSIFSDTYFRGLYVEDGGLAIKGFGAKFRRSLRPDEVIEFDEAAD